MIDYLYALEEATAFVGCRVAEVESFAEFIHVNIREFYDWNLLNRAIMSDLEALSLIGSRAVIIINATYGRIVVSDSAIIAELMR